MACPHDHRDERAKLGLQALNFGFFRHPVAQLWSGENRLTLTFGQGLPRGASPSIRHRIWS